MNRTLYVGNLAFVAEENQLLALFGADGRKVASIKIPKDKHTGRSRGYAFVEMETTNDAIAASDALNGKDFLGRPLSINEARGEQPSDGEGNLDQRRARIHALRARKH